MNNAVIRSEERHPFHSMCTYLGSFPPVVPRRILESWLKRRRTILDPFCGSGTALVEAALAGRRAIGIDRNPLAAAIAKAKLAPITQIDVQHRLSALAQRFEPVQDVHTVPDSVTMLFHERTLQQLCYLRDALDPQERVEDAFIVGVILGIMHGKVRQDGSTAYFSIDMPNTFSMSPAYVKKFIQENDLEKPLVDVFGKVRARIEWLLRKGTATNHKSHLVLEGDATQLHALLRKNGISHVGGIVTSPPYLGVLRYGAFNWIRLWFLKRSGEEVDAILDATSSLDRYLSFIASFLRSAAQVLRKNSPLVLVVGDVEENGTTLPLAERIWEELHGVVPFRLETLLLDAEFDPEDKTTRIWGEEKKGRATPRDRFLVLRRA